MATGINVIIEIIPAPPYVIVVPEPVATVTDAPDGDYFSDHEHEMLDLPSLDVGFSVQGKIGNIFMSHSHFFNSTGISISPPGPYTMNVVYTIYNECCLYSASIGYFGFCNAKTKRRIY